MPFAYDAEGQLRIADDRVTLTFRDIRYDPLGRLRQAGTGPVLVHASARLMAEYTGSTMTRRHVFGPGLDEPLVTYTGAAKSWHVADERGSVVALANAAGAATATYGYGPHGEPDARGAPPRFGYTGALVMDGMGLTQMRARTYSHRLGRFLQTDPIGQAGGLNLYDYAGGDAVNATDPWGLAVTKCLGCNWQSVVKSNAPAGAECGPGGGCALSDGSLWCCSFPATPAASFSFGVTTTLASHGGPGERGEGGEGESEKEKPVCRKPPAPPGVDVNRNIRLAAARGRSTIATVGNRSVTVANLGWFYNQVNTGHKWDLKTGGSAYIDSGNFNYGATGTAMGLSPAILYAGAGFAQIRG